MRRLVTLISIVLMAVSASAQEPELPVTDGLKLIAEKDWTKETEYNGWMIFNDDGMIFPEIVDEGLALTNPEVQAQIWTPQEYVLDDFSLEQDHDYIVRLFLKVPSDGTYQVVMGSWATNVNVQVPVTARDDFQVIDVEFPDFSRGAESAEGLETCHVLLQCGWVVGTTILKKVQVLEVEKSAKVPEPSETDELKLVYDKNWVGADFFWSDLMPNDRCELTAEGFAIPNPEPQEEMGHPYAIISTENFSLEQGNDYIVRLTLKVPSDGTYQVDMGSLSSIFSSYVPATACDDFQEIDAEFPQFAGNTMSVDDLEFSHLLLQCNEVVGTTVLQRVQVYEKVNGGTTAIKATKASKVTNANRTDDVIYNLAGQRVDASYKGVVIKNGKKRIMR